jgi:hypothetical protein
MDWIATIFTWLGNFFSHKQEKAAQQAAADHVTAAVESTQIEEMNDAENIRASAAGADHDDLVRRSEPDYRD